MIRSRNSSSGSSKSTVLRNTVLPLLLGALLSTAARGQGFGPDPFQPYNSQYAPFVYPVAPGPMDYGYNNGLARGVRGANQFENYLNSLQTSAAGRGREPRARAHLIFRPIGLTTVSSAASTSPTSWRTSNSRPTRQVSTSCTSSTCGRKTPRNAPRSSAIIAARGAGPIEYLPLPGACRVHNQGHVRPGARDAPQGPRTQRERRTEISWPHRRPRPLTRRAPALDRPAPVRIRPSGRLPCHWGVRAPQPILAAAARPPRFWIAPRGPIGLGLDLGHAVPDWIRQALHLPDDRVI